MINVKNGYGGHYIGCVHLRTEANIERLSDEYKYQPSTIHLMKALLTQFMWLACLLVSNTGAFVLWRVY